MFKIEYSHEKNANWFEQIVCENEFCLYNLNEPSSLYPLLGDIEHDQHSLNYKSIFYHISKLKDKKIYIICSDINCFENFNIIRQQIKYNSEINLYCYPWFFLNQYFYFEKYELEHSDFEIKYNAIFLSGAKKMCRLHVVRELFEYDNFIYSNMGWIDDAYVKNSKRINNYILNDDGFELNIEGSLFKTTGDFSIGSLKYDYKNFSLDEYIYYPPSKLDYKYIDKIDFTKPHCLYELVPEEFLKSAVSLFCETQTTLTSHLTEKTIKNLYYKKPFLGFACKGYYKFLKNNGFELYDELFDYSFDNFEYKNRLNAFINESKKILEMSLPELIYEISKIKEKIEYNYQNGKKISDNFSEVYNFDSEQQIDYIFKRVSDENILSK